MRERYHAAYAARMARRVQDDQVGGLFGSAPIDRALDAVPPAPVPADVRALAARMPAAVHLGTSSWAYPGWRGIVFGARAPVARLASDGLAAYAAWPLHRTVGLDRAFYAAPTETECRELAALVPTGFRFTVKAEQSVVRPDADHDGRTFGSTTALRAAGTANPRFLDAHFAADRIVAPAVAGLGAALGPIVLQFPALDLSVRGRLGGAERFVDALHAFLDALGCGAPGTPVLAVEPRNRELLRGPLAARYAAMLRATGAVHSYLGHPTMPSVGAQARALAEAGAPAQSGRAVLARWMLLPDATYEAAADRFGPFDRLQAPDPAARSEIVELLAAASPARPGFVVVNNKAEGSAVRSVEELARALAPDNAG